MPTTPAPKARKSTPGNAGKTKAKQQEAEQERELTIAEEIDALTDPSFMTSLARGLAVIRAFSDSRRSLTIAQISQKTGIPRAAVRRCLHTLKQLGYADSEVNNFSLRPKILTLGYSYLSSTPLTISAQPYLNNISRTLGESCSLAVLDDNEVLYVARSAASRVMSVALNTGSRLPAYCTSLGRVMLSHLPDDQLKAYFEKVKLRALTDKTVVSQKRLREILARVREAGYAVIDEELEVGLRSIAVPVRGASGNVLAALNVGAQAARVSQRQMEEEILPVLLRGAQELSVLLP
ncbi:MULTISPECIES: IclR family transcriptional regulator C-terminal domain-containing protein [unclassified Herbaspirillum]|uniref:IclR family transcriptional regulator domain-containing protein n=1 Tax=unclassified Herbaspirillum TaxID=2624150 RepID=UPI0011525006|nr:MULTISPECIES: IclR family transcriptional regulator C-terminal domain-containing protein [unclassified Herbaspirillum]MBB5392324.1 IclR family pca regulon transcriptional regulator [Herbaspirillum sp. SJZ102]TQK05965.1 IclR family transcriptional regulator [Herbaspirillum sp. SJZ130]TQK12557.1 IclR family transcriptional regulator [Herbaspirillum sp. SJZ106]TWC68185.1 IclR family transcriptional regulator [Herbaspirillum sp. SJZ099]